MFKYLLLYFFYRVILPYILISQACSLLMFKLWYAKVSSILISSYLMYEIDVNWVGKIALELFYFHLNQNQDNDKVYGIVNDLHQDCCGWQQELEGCCRRQSSNWDSPRVGCPRHIWSRKSGTGSTLSPLLCGPRWPGLLERRPGRLPGRTLLRTLYRRWAEHCAAEVNRLPTVPLLAETVNIFSSSVRE